MVPRARQHDDLPVEHGFEVLSGSRLLVRQSGTGIGLPCRETSWVLCWPTRARARKPSIFNSKMKSAWLKAVGRGVGLAGVNWGNGQAWFQCSWALRNAESPPEQLCE